jgi:hypothetical protein
MRWPLLFRHSCTTKLVFVANIELKGDISTLSSDFNLEPNFVCWGLPDTNCTLFAVQISNPSLSIFERTYVLSRNNCLGTLARRIVKQGWDLLCLSSTIPADILPLTYNTSRDRFYYPLLALSLRSWINSSDRNYKCVTTTATSGPAVTSASSSPIIAKPVLDTRELARPAPSGKPSRWAVSVDRVEEKSETHQASEQCW